MYLFNRRIWAAQKSVEMMTTKSPQPKVKLSFSDNSAVPMSATTTPNMAVMLMRWPKKSPIKGTNTMYNAVKKPAFDAVV